MRFFTCQFFFCLFLLFLVSCQRHGVDDEVIQNTRKLALADSLNHFNPKAADSIYRCVLRDSSDENRSAYISALVGLSAVYRNRSGLDSAGALLNKAIELASSVNDTSSLLNCFLELGNMYLDLGNSTQSENCYKKGLSLATKINSSKYQNKFLLSLGNSQHDRGDYPLAVKTFTEGVKIAEKTNDEQTLAAALENLAITIKYTGELSEAIAYMKRSLQIRKKQNLIREYAMGLQNLGILYRNAEKEDSALIIYHQAYDILYGLNDSVNMVKVRYNIGVILKNQKKYREAELEMNSILAFCRQKKINDGQTYALSALASIYEQTNRAAMGLDAIDSAISMAQRYHLNANLSILFDRRHEILAAMGRYNEAYQAALTSGNISDSLLSLENLREIATLKTRFDTERKESENISLKKDIEVQNSRMWILRISIILGSLVFIVMTILFYIRQKQVKQQKQLAEEKSIRIEHEKRSKETELEKIMIENQMKEQELVFQSLVQADLIQINRSVKEKLFPFKLKLPRKNQQDEFEQVLNGLTRDAGKDPLAEFELLFRQLHASFYDNALRICPDLTKTELHVCAMIRLNLSTKDIARLTNINISSIEMTRFHIRKKLNMEQGENLAAFLMTV